MSMTDPIADMLTRVRNALKCRMPEVELDTSKFKEEISRILKEEGFIKDFKITKDAKGPKKTLKLTLKYGPENESVITGLRRISKPSLRIYAKCENLPRVMGGYGIAILSTSKGIMTEKKSRRAKLGGEVVCYVW